MMDAREAVKGLDGYGETLASLIALLSAKWAEEKSEEHDALLAQIKQAQIDGRWIANAIMKEIHTVGSKAGSSSDLTGISAAIQRYVAVDQQASEAMKTAEKATKPNEVAEALRRFRLSAGLITE
jgi:hypothetical protein